MAVVGTSLAGVTLATAIAWLARRAGSLTTSGAVAAAICGTVAVIAGWSWAIVLIVYFVSASLLSRYRADVKAERAGDRVEKAGARDAVQVVANGGAFTAMALGHIARPDVAWQALAAGALAASAADTWATEIGLLAGQHPRSIIHWRVVPPGTSGGVTLVGFGAAAIGAAVVAGVASLVQWPAIAVVSAVVGGLLGCVVDSLLGASFQARRWCASCKVDTEQRIHRCGTLTQHTRGITWLDNDAVNVVATLSGALLGATAAFLLLNDA